MNESKFWERVDRAGGPDACWPHIDQKGYGRVRVDGHEGGAHRIAYRLAARADAGALHVLHRCDNPPCCNPAHLFAGTHRDNMADRDAKGRGHNPQGEAHANAKLTETDVIEIRRLWAAGVKQIDIAPRMGIAQTTVSTIVRRKAWTHI